MSALVPGKRNVRASGLKHTSEHLNLFVRNDWIASAWRQQHMHAVEIGSEIHRKRNHRTIQNCARKQVRIQEHQARGVIGAIRIPHRHDTFVSKPVPLGRGCRRLQVRKVFGAARYSSIAAQPAGHVVISRFLHRMGRWRVPRDAITRSLMHASSRRIYRRPESAMLTALLIAAARP